jgi:hypothetical protein
VMSAPSSAVLEKQPSAVVTTPTLGEEPSSTATAQIVGGKKRGLWGLLEESELAKSIRKDEEKKVHHSATHLLTIARYLHSYLHRWRATS